MYHPRVTGLQLAAGERYQFIRRSTHFAYAGYLIHIIFLRTPGPDEVYTYIRRPVSIYNMPSRSIRTYESINY